MAHQELQGRLKLAEQQVRMYREAIEHLMAAPTQTDPLQADESTNPVETPDSGGQRASSFEDGDCFMEDAEGAHGIRTGSGCQGGHSAPVGGGQQYSFSSNRQDELVASCGGVPTTSSSARRLRKGANMHIWGLIEDTVGRIGEEAAGSMAQMGANRERHGLVEDMDRIRKRRAVVWREREQVAQSRADLARCRGELLSRGIVLDARRSDLAEARQNCRTRKALYSEQLVQAMNMGALNDSFLIWQQGPFATINGFRVGRLNGQLVDWQEVNAGVGQAAIILVTVAMSMGVEFSKYLIAPCGSFTKIARSEDGRVLYSLHTDESFSLFPRRSFNLALKAFLHCLGEVGDHVQEHDPTLRLPYHIKEKEGTVGGLPVALGNSLEDWTRALKYMLTDLKWIAAWAAKYLPPC